MSLNVLKKSGLKDKYYYQAIELLVQPEPDNESKLRELLRENLQSLHKSKAAALGRPAASSRPGTPIPPHVLCAPFV